jgi:argininosuccinate lyase
MTKNTTNSSHAKLSSARLNEPTDAFVERFTASISFDKMLYRQDIQGSIAHAKMLHEQSILTQEDYSAIEQGLLTIQNEIDANQFHWSIEQEDVHMNIESRLIDLIGETGKKLHTGRSRNDQVATDIRLYLREAITTLTSELSRLQTGIISLASQEFDTIMPGFTHLQTAQPITLGHHLLAWNEMLERDYERFIDCTKRVNTCPLGSAALAGTTFPINRSRTAELLHFDRICRNSIDAVSDRDFAIEFTATASILMMHLSRFSEELILWTSAQFQFINLPDRFCTGSSIMPQKKNPDVPELIRGKTGRVNGHLVSLLTLMKSQPLAYNKDNQEDKEPLFDTVATLLDCLKAYADMIPAIKPNREVLRNAALKGFATATDLADYLVRKEIPFRDAHDIVGQVVSFALNNDMTLEDLSLSQLQSYSPKITEDVFDVLSLEGSVSARDHFGGTAPNQVKKAAILAMSRINDRSVQA